jgi:molybdopterin-guanine dinucleotide biosynthesis protein MobB
MRIIQVAGRSNSGKTTFIKELIPTLNRSGQVAVIKHLADHEFQLEEGKDTTGFFDAGARISIGIDAAKAVLTVRGGTLDQALQFLYQQGINYVIIEGYKQRAYPKIVIGDLEIEGTVLRNPTVDEVIGSLEQFEVYNGWAINREDRWLQ